MAEGEGCVGGHVGLDNTKKDKYSEENKLALSKKECCCEHSPHTCSPCKCKSADLDIADLVL